MLKEIVKKGKIVGVEKIGILGKNKLTQTYVLSKMVVGNFISVFGIF